MIVLVVFALSLDLLLLYIYLIYNILYENLKVSLYKKWNNIV